MSRAVTLIGLCWEGRDNAHPGAALAPGWLRWGLEDAEVHSLHQGCDLPELYDLGDRYFLPLEPAEAVAAMSETVRAAVAAAPERPLLVLGGDHLVTLPVVAALEELGRGPRWLIHLDAHLDQRDRHQELALSHATVMRRVEERTDVRVVSFGIRSRAPEEPWARDRRFRELLPALRRWLAEHEDEGPFYLSLDLDVLDPAALPTVSNPEPGGCDFAELIAALALLRGRLLAADLVEFVPTLAGATSTARSAGILLRELAIALGG